MAETQKRRSPVWMAVLLFLAAAAGLGAAFYFLDGMGIVSDLMGWERDADAPADVSPPSVDATTTPVTGGLRLPEGVDEEYALRLWQEQIDSQENIRKLVEGEITEFTFGKTSYDAYEGDVLLTAKMKGGASASGRLHMAKRGERWYVEYVSGLGASGVATPPTTALPALEDVDVDVLNTVFAEQSDSQEVFEDYLAGNVVRVVMREVKPGPGTATILATMYEKDHTVDAEIVVISTEVDGEKMWFLSRFEKTAETPKS